MKFKVLVTDKLEKEGIDILKKYKEIEVIEKDTMTPEELKEDIKNYDGIIIRSATKLKKDILEHADNLKVISRAGVGVDNIDIPAATAKGIVVMNAPLGNTISTAELAFSLIISLARKIPFAYASMKENKWERTKFTGTELRGKTLGVIGLGRIGTEVAKRAKAFEMNILGFDPYLSEERAKDLGIELSDLPRIYKESDFITIHTPLTEQTKGMIGKNEIEMMKKTVRIVNAARGEIVSEQALADALKEGRIAGAAVDVYSKEPPFEPRNPLLDAPNLVAVPHLGASTEEAQFMVAMESAETVANFLVHGVIVNSMNMPSINKELFEEFKVYIKLAESLGSMISQVIEGQVEEVTVSYEGDISHKDVSLLTRAALKGLFQSFLGESVNYVNAVSMSQSRGITVTEKKDPDFSSEYTNLIRMNVRTASESMELWGCVYSSNVAKIVKFNEYFFELKPEGIFLFIYNEDKPGVVGKIGTILGGNNVNIAGLMLGRNTKTKLALSLVQIDSAIDEKVRKELEGIDAVKTLKVVKL
ncbi:MAG: phosphoglycerate dehydrogenase [Spirochaetes bacterium GWF1_51_8]|nr:MAG: phosphoglycerate dehydrogenase [Spirochaetes bacterium GWF1_51_8]